MKKKILILDNYDSFTYNLVQQVKELSSHSFDVVRNDVITVEEASTYDAFILSPGPGLHGIQRVRICSNGLSRHRDIEHHTEGSNDNFEIDPF